MLQHYMCNMRACRYSRSLCRNISVTVFFANASILPPQTLSICVCFYIYFGLTLSLSLPSALTVLLYILILSQAGNLQL